MGAGDLPKAENGSLSREWFSWFSQRKLQENEESGGSERADPI
jgi:hypothetical protein